MIPAAAITDTVTVVMGEAAHTTVSPEDLQTVLRYEQIKALFAQYQQNESKISAYYRTPEIKRLLNKRDTLAVRIGQLIPKDMSVSIGRFTIAGRRKRKFRNATTSYRLQKIAWDNRKPLEVKYK